MFDYDSYQSIKAYQQWERILTKKQDEEERDFLAYLDTFDDQPEEFHLYYIQQLEAEHRKQFNSYKISLRLEFNYEPSDLDIHKRPCDPNKRFQELLEGYRENQRSLLSIDAALRHEPKRPKTISSIYRYARRADDALCMKGYARIAAQTLDVDEGEHLNDYLAAWALNGAHPQTKQRLYDLLKEQKVLVPDKMRALEVRTEVASTDPANLPLKDIIHLPENAVQAAAKNLHNEADARQEYVRKRKGKEPVYQVGLDDSSFIKIAKEAPTPENEFLMKERVREVRRVLSENLTKKQRDVLLLRGLEQLSSKEVAERLNMTVGAVNTCLNETRKKLSSILLNPTDENT